MSLKLMYITNNPAVGLAAESAGIDYVFVDLEYIGKEERQPNMDTVKSHHTLDDVMNMAKVIHKSKILVRINPLFSGSKEEIECAIANGANAIMLPMYKNPEDVKKFISLVNGRAEVFLLLETISAEETLSDVVCIPGIDRIHIGLNDLHLEKGKNFMFELLTDGTVHRICEIIRKAGIPYGFGGVSRLGCGMLPAEYIIGEHIHEKSTSVILSRDFCDQRCHTLEEIEDILANGVSDLRQFEKQISLMDESFFLNNKERIFECIKEIIRRKNENGR